MKRQTSARAARDVRVSQVIELGTPLAVHMRFVIGSGGFLGEVSLTRSAKYGETASFCLELTDLFVHPMRRSQGWATHLMQVATHVADDLGVELRLFVRPHGDGKRLTQKQLIRFYQGFGFCKTGDRVLTEAQANEVEMLRSPQKR